MQEITPTDIPSVKEYKVLSLQDLPEGLKLCDLALQCNAEALELKFLTPQEYTEGVKFCGSYRTTHCKETSNPYS